MTNRVVHFEIPAKNPTKLSNFYKKAFNWKFEKWNGPFPYWMVMTGNAKKPGIDGGLAKKGRNMSKVINTIDVKDIGKAIKDIKKSGGKIVVKKMSVPGVGYMAYFLDPEGNQFGIMQIDMKAK